MRFLSLGWRNTRRNGHRTLLTLSAIAFCVAALVLAWAYFDGESALMTQNMTGYSSGHVQVHRRGFDKDPSLNLAFRAQDAVTEDTVTRSAGVVGVAPRVSGAGLLSTERNTRGALVTGVDPAREPQVTVVHTKMIAGRYLEPGREGGAVIGRLLAEAMGVDVGGELVILADGRHASIGAGRYRVDGIFETGNDMVDGQQVLISLPDAYTLFNTGGQVTTVAFRLASLDDVDRTVSALQSALGGRYEVLGWRTKLPDVADHIDFHEALVGTVMVLLFFIVTAGVANTLVMAITERRREFGVLMAMGTSPWQLFRAIVYEGLCIGTLGFVLGLAVAWAALAWLGQGFEFASEGRQALTGASSKVYPLLRWDRVALVAGGMFLVVLAGTVFPAWRAARLTPIVALRGLAGAGRARGARRPNEASATRFITLMLALRNLRRSPLRSGLGLAAIVASLAAYVFFSALAEGFRSQTVANATGLFTGDVQLQHADFRAQMRPSLSFEAGPSLLEAVRGLPQVRAASRRVQAVAMLGSTVRADSVDLIGIEPLQEPQVTFVHRAIRDGGTLQRERDVMIGTRLAERLGVRVGERVIAMLQDANGNLASEALTVAAIFSTGSREMDAQVAYVMLPKLQAMLGIGTRVTGVAVRLHDRALMEEAVPALAAMLPSGDVRVLRWSQLMPQIAQVSDQLEQALAVIGAIAFGIVAVVLMNGTLMSVMERAKEFGTLLAIGAGGAVVIRLVALEAALLACVGTLAGALVGGSAAWALSRTGLSLGGSQMSGVAGVTDMLYPEVSAPLLIAPSAALFILILVTSLYPAAKVARVDPARTLRST